MKKYLKSAVLISFFLTLSGGVVAAADVPENDDPIKLVLNDWTGQFVSTKIAGELLKKMGYNIEYVSAGALPQFTGLAQGNLHFQAEVWDNNIGDYYPKALQAGNIEEIGELGLDAWQDWMYPTYLEEKCPELPKHTALWNCAQLFATADTFPKGRLITYPADWGTRSRDLVAAIDLPYEPIPGGSEGAMMAEIQSAYAAEEPILIMWWAPHWVFADLDFKWIDWHKPWGKCDDLAQSEAQTPDNMCGFEQPTVVKVVWSGLKDKWPAAHKLLSNFKQTNEDQNAAILEIDNKGRDLDEVVAEWLANNEDRWQVWVDEAMM